MKSSCGSCAKASRQPTKRKNPKKGLCATVKENKAYRDFMKKHGVVVQRWGQNDL